MPIRHSPLPETASFVDAGALAPARLAGPVDGNAEARR